MSIFQRGPADIASMRVFLRSTAALIAGYAAITIVTVFGFELILGHALVRKDDPREVVLGTLIAVAAGLAGGWIATVVGVLRPMANASLAAVPVAIESSVLLLFRTPPDELIFSAMGALVLMGSTIGAGVWRELVESGGR